MSTHVDTELLSAYLDGEVPGSERAGLELHLASCAECSARKSALEGVIRSVKQLPPVTATDAERRALRRAVLDRASTRSPVRTLRPGGVWKVFGATAAVAAVLAGIVAFAVVKGQGPKVTGAASAPLHLTPSPGPPPNLSSDADVRSYAASLAGVSSFLGQIHVSAGDRIPQAAAVPSPGTQQFGATNGAVGAPSVPGTAQKATPGVSPPTLGSCARDAVPTGAAVLQATPVLYQGAPSWVIAYGASSVTAGALDRVIVEVRSQSTCGLLDQATLTP
jgi:hypothetical protein